MWGIGQELSEKQWRSALRQLLARGIGRGGGRLRRSGARPGSRSRPAQRGHRRTGRGPITGVPIVRPIPCGRRVRGIRSRAADSLEPAAREVFEALREWRTSVAKEKQIPPYMVFSDATLVAIIETNPTSIGALGTVSGVGAKKLAEYGEPVLETLAEATGGSVPRQSPARAVQCPRSEADAQHEGYECVEHAEDQADTDDVEPDTRLHHGPDRELPGGERDRVRRCRDPGACMRSSPPWSRRRSSATVPSPPLLQPHPLRAERQPP